ncbi:MAG: hypothetical protein IPF99_18645 [Deltaproteobacteria bacterium]|nr:hypothetical protein [Deltaproteobacteria bacterium]
MPERLETSLPSIEQIEHELEVPPAVTAAQGGRRASTTRLAARRRLSGQRVRR